MQFDLYKVACVGSPYYDVYQTKKVALHEARKKARKQMFALKRKGMFAEGIKVKRGISSYKIMIKHDHHWMVYQVVEVRKMGDQNNV